MTKEKAGVNLQKKVQCSNSQKVNSQTKNRTLLDIVREQTGYNGKAKTRLYLSELGYGTRFSDPRIAEGLNAWLTINNYQNQIDHLVINGGLFPEFPPFYSVGNAEKMRLLDQNPEKKAAPTSPRIEEFFENVLGSKEAANFAVYRKKWLVGKINTWDDCKSFTSKQLETMLESIDVSKIDYCQGDEDRFNMKYEEELKVNRLAREAKNYIKNLQKERDTLEESISRSEIEKKKEEVKYERLSSELAVLKAINPKLANHLRAKEPNVPHFIKNLLFQKEDSLFQDIDEKQKREFKKRLKGIDDEASFRTLYDDKANAVMISDSERKNAERDIGKAKEKMTSLEADIAAIERQLEQGDAITIFTKRASISPIEAEWIYKSVKNEYINDIYSCFPKRLRKKLATHVSGSVKITDVAYGPGKDEVLKEAEISSMSGSLMMMHSTRFSSNATTLNSLSDAQQEILWRKALEKIVQETEGLVPKTIVVAHGAGGLGITRINTSYEFRAIDGSYRDKPSITTIISLPTMHSTGELLKFYDKRMNKNWGTKRFSKKMHASAPVIQTVLEDGSEINFAIDTSSLIAIAEQKRKMSEHKKSSAEYKTEEEKLKQMCSILPKSRAILTDIHIGAANFAGTPSNYERLSRTINYLAANYNGVDELILSEFPDGVLSHTSSDRKFMGKTLPELREEIAVLLDRNTSEGKNLKDDYLVALEQVIKLFTDAMSQNALPNLDKQYEAIHPYIKRIVEEIKPSQATLMSGNHARSNEGADEASRLADIIKVYDKEKIIKLVLSDAIGHKFGGQGGIREKETGKTVGYHHEPEGGKNALVSTINHLLSSNYGFDEFFAGHIHTPYAGYANGVAVTIGPACEGPTDYSIKLPVPSSPYGAIIKYSNAAQVGHPANKVIWHAWHFVNDDTLERPEYRNDGLETMIGKISAKD